MIKPVYDFSDLQQWSTATADAHPPLRLAVIGDPVAHSASPQMHNAALEKLGLDVRYTRVHLRPEELAEALKLLPAAGFMGINATIPHKAALLPLVTRVDEHARRIGAINTVLVEGDTLTGFNTDGPGLVRAVRSEFGVDLRDLRVMVLGAGGGAGRAIAVQCALERCERLVLVNRSPERAAALLPELAALLGGPHVSGPLARLSHIPWEEEAIRREMDQLDLIINCTSLGMKAGESSPLPSALLQPHLMVYDTIYTANRTKLCQAAEEAGARAANGFSMLLHQGALAFEIWFNRPAPLDVMRAALQAVNSK
jgi:shikimate dehydrogenase